MASKTIDSHREGAEVHKGDEICKRKSIELLEELGLPKGLWPLENIQEFGYNRATGFIWLVQEKSVIHSFKKIKRTVSYAAEVTAFVEPRKMKKITGVKSKELFLWITITEMYISDPSSGKITIKTGTGISDTLPSAAFELEQ